MLTLRTLGSLNLLDPGGRELTAVISQPKRYALFVYLVMGNPGGFIRRDTLLGHFWPERDEPHARNALSQGLSFLRKHLPPDVIVVRGMNEVSADGQAIHADVDDFESAVAAGSWREALRLYAGDFLKGFHLNGANGFEEWVDWKREALREAAASAAWALAGEQIREGALVEAERTAQRALTYVWTDETPVREFTRSLAEAGDQAAAVSFCDRYSARLRSELEVEPSPETTAVAEAIRKNGRLEVVGLASLGPEPHSRGGNTAKDGPSSGVRTPRDGGLPPPGPPSPGLPEIKRGPFPQPHVGVVFWFVAALVPMIFGWRVFNPFTPPLMVERVLVQAPEPTADPEQNELLAGMHRGLIDGLNQISGVTALSRSTALALTKSGLHLTDLADRVSADAVLEWDGGGTSDSTWAVVCLYGNFPTESLLWSSRFVGYPGEHPDLSEWIASALSEELGIPIPEGGAMAGGRYSGTDPPVLGAYAAGG